MIFFKHKDEVDIEGGDKEAGFTLIEMLVVMVIMALLIGVVSVNVFRNIDKAKITRVEADVSSIATAMEMYKLDQFDFPAENDGLQALVAPPDGVQPYLSTVPKDPWGNDYIYRYPGEQGRFDIISLGADGAEGGEGPNADIIKGQ